MLDLSGMRALESDAEGSTACPQTGLSTGEYTAAVGARGLATGLGDTGSVGIGGITLGGRVGYLVRKLLCLGSPLNSRSGSSTLSF